MIFHNESNCRFIVKELSSKFEGEFNYLGESTKKHKTFLVPVTKEVKRVDENGNEYTFFYKQSIFDPCSKNCLSFFF